MRERFDKKFGKESELAKFMLLKYGTQIFHTAVHERVLDFIEQEISQALENERNRIKNKLKEYQEKGFDMQTVVESDNLI